MTRDVADDSQDWWWFQKIDYFHIFSLLVELIPKLTTCPYFFGVETVESTYWAGFTSWPQALLWSHATLGLPGHQDWRGMSVAVTKCPWLDLTRPVFRKHMPQELYEKNLSRTWQDLDSCMDQSSGPRDDYIGAYFSARVHVFSRMDRMEKTACFQNSEPSELGGVYKQTALLLTVAPTSSLFFAVGRIVDKVTVVPASDVNIHTFARISRSTLLRLLLTNELILTIICLMEMDHVWMISFIAFALSFKPFVPCLCLLFHNEDLCSARFALQGASLP